MRDYMRMVYSVFVGWGKVGLATLLVRLVDPNVRLSCAVTSLLCHQLVGDSSDL